MNTKDSTEKLTVAVIELTKRFKKNEELVKKSGIIAKMQRGTSSLIGSLKEKASDAFSVKGVGSMLGINATGMIGQYLEGRHEGIKKNKANAQEDKVKAMRFAKNFSKYTEEGKGLDEQAAIRKGVKLYEEQKKILEEIKKIKDDIAEAEELGQGAIAKNATAGELSALEKRLSSLYDTPQKQEEQIEPAASGKKLSKAEASIIADMIMKKGNAVDLAAENLEKTQGEKVTKADRKELSKWIKAGMIEELLASNAEQVAQLRILVERGERSEEEMLESKIKSAPGAIKPISESKKDKETGGILDMFGNLFKGIINLIPGLGNLLKFIPSIISAGSTLVTFMANPLVLAAVAAFTALSLLGKEKTKEGDGSVEKFADTSVLAGAMSAGATGTEGAAIMSAVEENPQTPDEIKAFNNKNNELLKDAPFLTRVYGYKAKEYIEEMQKSRQGVSRQGLTIRESQTNSLAQNRSIADSIASEKAKAESKNSPSANVVTTNNVSNKTSVTKLAPPTRNIDPTYNDRLSFGSAM